MEFLNTKIRADPIHVILALANLMDADGTLNDETAARVDHATQVFLESGGSRIMFIGWDYRTDSCIAICDAMATYCKQQHSIPHEAIILNEHSRDTVGDAILSRIQLDRMFQNFRLSVVTTDYHVRRVEEVFSQVYGPQYEIEFYGSASSHGALNRTAEINSQGAYSRTFEGVEAGDILQFRDRMLCAHPFYNGTSYPDRPVAKVALEIGPPAK